MEEIKKIIAYNHTVHGKLNQIKKSDKLIIFVHGLGGNINEHIFFNGYKFFNKNGFDTFRINFYYETVLTNNSVSNQSKDLEIIINYFKDKYDEIYLIGHSLGGPIILLADISIVKKIVLRDPVLDTNQTLKSELHYNGNFNYVSWGMDIIIGETMKNEVQSIGDINSKLDHRVKIIYAGNNNIQNEFTNKDIEHVVIKGADHCFHNEGNEELLFHQTLEFIKS